jgi:YbbR domain-containing protein
MLDEKAERVIPIQIKSDLTFKDLFRLKESIKVEPQTIVISGPKAVVEVFDAIGTKTLKLSDIDSDYSGKIEIEPLNHSEINYSLNSVNWEIKVEQFTEGKLKLPLSVDNVPKGYEIKLFPDEVTVNYLVSLDKFELVKTDMFSTNINFDSEYKRLPIELVRQADFVENVRISPSKIEYFLIKK